MLSAAAELHVIGRRVPKCHLREFLVGDGVRCQNFVRFPLPLGGTQTQRVAAGPPGPNTGSATIRLGTPSALKRFETTSAEIKLSNSPTLIHSCADISLSNMFLNCGR